MVNRDPQYQEDRATIANVYPENKTNIRKKIGPQQKVGKGLKALKGTPHF